MKTMQHIKDNLRLMATLKKQRKASIEAFYKDLGANIKRLREAAGITQAELAAAVGIERSSIANIEAGRQRTMAHHLVFLGYMLDCKPSELIPEEGDRR